MGWLWAPVSPQSEDLEIILSDFCILVFWYSRDSGGTWSVVHNPALCSVSKPELVFLFTLCLVPMCLCLHWEIAVASDLKHSSGYFLGVKVSRLYVCLLIFLHYVFFWFCFNCKHHLNLDYSMCCTVSTRSAVWFWGVWKCFFESGKWWVQKEKKIISSN